MNKYQKALEWLMEGNDSCGTEWDILQELIDKHFEVKTDEISLPIQALIDLAKGDIGIEEITGMSIEEMEEF